MARLFLHVLLAITACAPLIWLVADMARRYPLEQPLLEITLVDAVLLAAALGLPVFLLARLGVNWRTDPPER